MNIREERENLEEKILSEFAVKSKNSKGRKVKENLCEIRTVFHQDKDRIIHSKSFRRLKHKTQVFISYQPGDHYRTRLTHTLEVSQISRTIARALNLNEDLTEAIALGHDLGHTPFGHSGENVLNKISFLGFKHNKQSLRVVENLEKKGKGLNLSEEVLDGILNHTGQNMPYTLEGQIVKISDRIAYINHDIEDGISANLLKNSDLPKDFIEILGKTTSERIDKMVIDMIKYSRNQNKIKMSKEVEEAILGLRKFLFENLYFKGEVVEKLKKSEKIIEALYFYYQENYDKVYFNYSEKKERNILDYISGMTDSYALEKFKNIYIP